MVQDSPSRKQDQFIVRLPDGMRERIKSAAEANNRSMNAEIVATLEEKYPAPDPKQAIIARVAALIEDFSTGPATEERLQAWERLRTTMVDFGNEVLESRRESASLTPEEENEMLAKINIIASASFPRS